MVSENIIKASGDCVENNVAAEIGGLRNEKKIRETRVLTMKGDFLFFYF